jgi:hypothetical protein
VLAEYKLSCFTVMVQKQPKFGQAFEKVFRPESYLA